MDFIESYQWDIFMTLEIASWLCLLAFGILRYMLDKRRMSLMFLISFVTLIAFEELLALLIYQKTGIIASFQIIILIFVVCAVTVSVSEVMAAVKDLSWVGTEEVSQTSYQNETIYGISMVWGIVFIVDFIYSWSYTFFPSKEKDS